MRHRDLLASLLLALARVATSRTETRVRQGAWRLCTNHGWWIAAGRTERGAGHDRRRTP